METIKVLVQSEDGLHARPAGLIAKTAARFKSNISISSQGLEKNAKSIMSIMSMGIKGSEEITFTADGEDAREALTALDQLFQSQFGTS